MQYKIGKSVTGKPTVLFACPRCKAKLVSKISKVGKADSCPECQHSFTTPGAEEVAKIARQKVLEKAKLRKAEKIRQRQEALLKSELEDSERRREASERDKQSQRKALLQDTELDLSTHDWSTGGPYVYESVELGRVSESWTNEFNKVSNSMAEKGWEYYRSESLTAQRNNGCLLALMGNPHEFYSVVLLVFRKPTTLVRKEKSLR